MRILPGATASLVAFASLVPALGAEPVVTCDGLVPTITASAPGPVVGTDGADVILVTGAPVGAATPASGPVVVAALGGDDTICLSSNAANLVVGGDGTDTVSYEHAAQTVIATMNLVAIRVHVDLDAPISEATLVSRVTGLAPGIDLLPTTEILIGSPQVDVLIGHALNADTISGGAGDDIIVGLFGNDVLRGGDGDDLVVGDGYDAITYGPVGGFTFGPLTAPVLATDDDILEGGADGDALNDDTGNNIFRGGSGNDGISQGFGDDTIDGGSGRDHVAFVQAAATVDLTLAGQPQATGMGTDTLSNVEDMTGSIFDDLLIGSSASNIIEGGDGNDRIASNRLTLPPPTNDSLHGGPGTDLCYGQTAFNCEGTWLPPAIGEPLPAS